MPRLYCQLTVAEKMSAHGRTPELPAKRWQSKTSKPTRLMGHCFPDPVPGTSGKIPQKTCVVCWLQGKRKEAPTDALTASRLLVSRRASGSTTQS